MSFGFSVGDFIVALELAQKVRQRWIDAPKEYSSLRAENVENVLKTLVELVEQLEINVKQKDDLKTAGAHCVSILRQADEIVDKYSTPHGDGKAFSVRVRRTWQRLRTDPDDIRHLRDQLIATVTQLGAIQNNIEIEMVEDIAEHVDNLVLSNKQQRKAQIADWFAPSNFAQQQTDQLAQRYPGTAEWFLQSPKYVEWRGGSNQTLFCPGIPGSGKSIIVATAVDNLRHHFNQQKNVIVAYFYFNFRRQSEQRLHHILAVLVRQLFQEQQDLPRIVEQLYDRHKDRNTKPSVEELKILFARLVQSYSKVFLLFDALDECDDDDRSRSDLLGELFSLQTQSNVSMNLLGTSRFIPDIASKFKSTLQLEISAQQADLEIYLDSRMVELCAGVRKNKILQDLIKDKIIAAVSGMFLLARLHFESLQDKMSSNAVKNALSALPKGSEALDIAYEEAMVRINHQREGFCQTAKRILTWLVFAREVLSIEELQEAVTIEPGMDDIDRENDLLDSDEMISVCAGLVVVDQESHIVRLVHYTTQEFFERTKDKWLPVGQHQITQNCIDYLHMKVFATIPKAYRNHNQMLRTDNKIFRSHELLWYVGKHWGFHASLSGTTLENILDQDMLIFVWQLLNLGSWALRQYGNIPYKGITSIHICAIFNDLKGIRILLENGTSPNQSVSHGELTPLGLAAAHGYLEMAELLLAQPGIDINAGQPLWGAARNGHDKIVELLLSRPHVDVNLGQPLASAVDYGYTEVAKLLLAHPNIDANLGKPLHKAVPHGREIVELLLAHPRIDVNMTQLLACAVWSGNMEVSKMLLAHPGIDINSGYPLWTAVFCGRKEILELLLAHPGVDVNIGEPLSRAASYGNKEMVVLLLAHPDVNISLGDPLFHAKRKGHEEIVNLLLAHPNMNAEILGFSEGI